MDLVVIRHGVAVEREQWSGDDDLRPLTDDGVSKMRKGAQGIRTLVDGLDVLAASPLVRAQQTAQIVARALENRPDVETIGALSPGQDPEPLLGWLEHYRDKDVVAVVGHEPHLSTAASWLVSGRRQPLLELKKGGACLVRFEDAIEAGAARLIWLLTPAQLRALAR